MSTLRIAKDLELPLDAVTQKLAFLGRTGSGKTYGAKRLVEEMLRAGAQVVVLDPVGVWAGLRLGPKGFDVPVLGGLYGDIPLEPTAGALVADVAVDHGRSMVIDVSQMLDAERTRFATAFAGQFFARRKASPSAVHLVIEECQEFVPQNHQAGEEKMLHEFQRISKLGRNFGIGVSLISQRPQEVNKKALNQTECVFAFQMTGPQERKALEYWLSDKGFDGKLSELLPRLAVGAPHVWSPQWLKISKVVKILPIDSQDTSQTPKVGAASARHAELRPIDLKALQQAMSATVERAKAEDPKALRARVAELERELKERPEAVRETAMFDRAAFGELENALAAEITRVVEAATLARSNLRGELHCYMSKCLEAHNTPIGSVIAARPPKTSKARSAAPAQPDGTGDASVGNGGLRRILVALAQANRPLTRRQLGLRAGLSSQSGTFATYLARARSAGWVETTAGAIGITAAGRQSLGTFDRLPEGRQLLDYWVAELGDGSGAARMLRALAKVYPKSVSRDRLGELAEISPRSGTFATYLSRLRGLELVSGSGELQLSEELT